MLVEFLEAEVLGHEFTERIGDVTRAPKLLTDETNVGCHCLEGQQSGSLHETDHATEPALDVLSAGIAQVADDALDVAAPRVGGDPGG